MDGSTHKAVYVKTQSRKISDKLRLTIYLILFFLSLLAVGRFDESELYSEWNAVSLRSLSAPVIRPEGGTTGVISLLNSIMNETIVDDALSVFPG